MSAMSDVAVWMVDKAAKDIRPSIRRPSEKRQLDTIAEASALHQRTTPKCRQTHPLAQKAPMGNRLRACRYTVALHDGYGHAPHGGSMMQGGVTCNRRSVMSESALAARGKTKRNAPAHRIGERGRDSRRRPHVDGTLVSTIRGTAQELMSARTRELPDGLLAYFLRATSNLKVSQANCEERYAARASSMPSAVRSV